MRSRPEMSTRASDRAGASEIIDYRSYWKAGSHTNFSPSLHHLCVVSFVSVSNTIGVRSRRGSHSEGAPHAINVAFAPMFYPK